MKQNEKVFFETMILEEDIRKKEKELYVKIRIALELGFIKDVKFIINAHDEGEKSYAMSSTKNDDTFAYFATRLKLEAGLYYYHFSMTINDIYYEVRYIPKNKEICLTTEKNLPVWKLDVGFYVPKWARGANMYHIFIDRYRHSTKVPMVPMVRRNIHSDWNELPVIGPDANGLWNIDFFGGNLPGIEETLNYIKGLGCSIIYVSPPCYSQSNHRYDTADYEVVDPYIGDNESLKRLCDAAHRKKMYVIIDAVFNHVGNDSKYFNEYHSFDTIGAYEGKSSPYYNWFKRNERGEIMYWWGMKNLPECDGNCSEWENYICGVGGIIDKWFELGIDGLRLDVADELTDDFIRSIRKAVKRNKEDGFILGEVWKNPMRMRRKYLKGADGMDSVMNYLLVDALIRYVKQGHTNTLEYVMYQILMEYPETAVSTLMNFTSTHDISRILNIFGNDDFRRDGEWFWDLNPYCDLEWQRNEKPLEGNKYRRAKKMYKVYLTILAFMPGILTIFYGDEAGIQGMGNLGNRKTYPWGRRDKDLVKFVRKLLKLRNNLEFLKATTLTNYFITQNLIYLEREGDNEAILVVVNRSENLLKADIPEKYNLATIVYSTNNSTKDEIGPFGAIVLKK